LRETKAERAVRHDYELSQFVRVLQAAGNVVETELAFDMRPSDSSQSPPIPRKWKFDVVLPQVSISNAYVDANMHRIAIEIEGYGRHQSMKGFTADVSKYLEAFAQGWVLMRVTRQMISDGTALDALARRGVRVEKLVDP
jgi:hypothetical protein